jgi:protein O-GlcNAc transferase
MVQARTDISGLLDEVLALHDRGALDQAAAVCERALRQAPRNPDALHLLGITECLRGRLNVALPLFNRALTVAPGHALAQRAKGTLLIALGRPDEAVFPLRRATQLAPSDALAQMYLALALDSSGGEIEVTLAAFDEAVKLAPGSADIHYNRASVLRRHNRLPEAAAALRQAVELSPPMLDAWNNLGLTLRDVGDRAGAIAAWQQGAKHASRGDHTAAALWSNLGNLLDRPDELEARLDAHRRAVDLAPADARCHLNYAAALQQAGNHGTAWIHCGQAYDLDPQLTDQRQPEVGFYRVRDESRLLLFRRGEGDKLIAATAAERLPHTNPRDSEKRLRIGYVSPDLRASSAAYFIEPVLTAHDRTLVDVHCYASAGTPDAVTARLQSLGHTWHDVAALDDSALAAQIRADGIDILVDLAGQTRDHRLGVFARKPAPAQVTWIGSRASTGLAAMDWRIVDAFTDPPGLTEAHNSERLLRLPGGFLCYRPPDAAPEIGPPPSVAAGHVTFGSFNHVAKIGSEVIQLWSQLLKRVPGSRLLLKHAGLGDEPARRVIVQQFAAAGVGPQQLILRARIQEFADYLSSYAEIDLALDPFPYNGTTSTCEALWMGVPVVTLGGRRHVGRVGISLLSRCGLGELVAETPEQYLDIATALAGDRMRLEGLRSGMRQRVAASPLTDGPALTRALEAAYRDIWRAWCTS